MYEPSQKRQSGAISGMLLEMGATEAKSKLGRKVLRLQVMQVRIEALSRMARVREQRSAQRQPRTLVQPKNKFGQRQRHHSSFPLNSRPALLRTRMLECQSDSQESFILEATLVARMSRPIPSKLSMRQKLLPVCLHRHNDAVLDFMHHAVHLGRQNEPLPTVGFDCTGTCSPPHLPSNVISISRRKKSHLEPDQGTSLPLEPDFDLDRLALKPIKARFHLLFSHPSLCSLLKQCLAFLPTPKSIRPSSRTKLPLKVSTPSRQPLL
jgi:hypothetical protein